MISSYWLQLIIIQPNYWQINFMIFVSSLTHIHLSDIFMFCCYSLYSMSCFNTSIFTRGYQNVHFGDGIKSQSSFRRFPTFMRRTNVLLVDFQRSFWRIMSMVKGKWTSQNIDVLLGGYPTRPTERNCTVVLSFSLCDICFSRFVFSTFYRKAKATPCGSLFE